LAHVSTPTRAVSTPIAQAVRIAPSESVPHGARAVSTPVFKLAPIGRHSWRATSVQASERRVSNPPTPAYRRPLARLSTRPRPRAAIIAGLGRDHPPGPCPAKCPSPHIRIRPGPIPTQARASATGGFEHWPTKALYGWPPGQSDFLWHLRASYLAQQQVDSEGQVPWSRHLLACLHRITGAKLLVGVQAVTHF
jgi:hypothetical protein